MAKVGFRIPLKGEYYLSGAVPMAYRNDLTSSYWVVEPVGEPNFYIDKWSLNENGNS